MKKKSLLSNRKQIALLFDHWAKRNLDKRMEEGHKYAVKEALKKISFPAEMKFLDIGCGNGWVVRYLASHNEYRIGVGLDLSLQMIKKAYRNTPAQNLYFKQGDILSWIAPFQFNFVISMEAFYYVNPMEYIFDKIQSIMLKNGILLVGADYYSENTYSSNWGDEIGIDLDRRSASEWKALFKEYGFKVLWQAQIKYPHIENIDNWKSEFGSLFTCGRLIKI